MRNFREQGKSDHEVIKALNAKFGENYKITSRKMVKLGGIFGVGRRTGVEYHGYILEKAAHIGGTRLRNAGTANEPSKKWAKAHPPAGRSRDYISEQEQAERDRRNREKILERFGKNEKVRDLLGNNKKAQDLLGNKILFPDSGLPPTPHLNTERNAEKGQNPGFTSIYNPAEKTHADSGIVPTASGPSLSHFSGQTSPPFQGHFQERAQGQAGENWEAAPHPAAHPHPHSYAGHPAPVPANPGSPAPAHPYPPPSPLNGPSHSYSGDSESPYQQDLNQRESSFLQRLEKLERRLDRSHSLSEPPSLNQFREGMYANEFPPFFVERLLGQMKRELPLEELGKLEVLWEYVLLHIAENMRFIDVQRQSHARIMVLVGPTGVGKTTTIAKLAAQQCVQAMGGSKKVHLITLDNYRIGAQDQIRTYGEILEARVDCVETTEGLAACIAEDQDSDMILIDTMGRSPSDHMKLAEMRNFLASSGNCEIQLAMSATSGASALKEIITQFKPFGFRSVILTKLDELGRIGGTLATFLQEDIALSYVTTGQKVPQDICPASALVLFRQL
ncbi:MAG: AAA family ATPase, partial [Spirochaetota bacterium]